MDREQFDDVARFVWSKQPRRAALATGLGALLLGSAPGLVAARKNGKGNGNKKRNRRKRSGDPCQCMGRGFASPCFSYADCCTTTTNLVCGRSLNPHETDLLCLGGLNFPCSLPAACAVGFQCFGGVCQPDD